MVLGFRPASEAHKKRHNSTGDLRPGAIARLPQPRERLRNYREGAISNKLIACKAIQISATLLVSLRFWFKICSA